MPAPRSRGWRGTRCCGCPRLAVASGVGSRSEPPAEREAPDSTVPSVVAAASADS